MKTLIVTSFLLLGFFNGGFSQDVAVKPAIWTVDYVKANDGQLADLVQFYKHNWAKARKYAKRKKYVADFQWFVLPDNPDYQFVLMTKYKDQAQFEQREASFQKVFETVKPALVNGKSSRDMREIVKTEEYYEPKL